MLGSGDPIFEGWMRSTESSYKDKFRGWVGFSVPVSHRITAGYAENLTRPSLSAWIYYNVQNIYVSLFVQLRYIVNAIEI